MMAFQLLEGGRLYGTGSQMSIFSVVDVVVIALAVVLLGSVDAVYGDCRVTLVSPLVITADYRRSSKVIAKIVRQQT